MGTKRTSVFTFLPAAVAICFLLGTGCSSQTSVSKQQSKATTNAGQISYPSCLDLPPEFERVPCEETPLNEQCNCSLATDPYVPTN
jgi:hypothetical protein